jgi:hypothetical protein
MEVRKLSDNRSEKTVHTDFYEYYWAYQVGPPTGLAVLTWVAGFLIQPWRLSSRLAWPYAILIILVASIIAIFSWVICDHLPQFGSWIHNLMNTLGLGFSGLLTVISILFLLGRVNTNGH